MAILEACKFNMIYIEQKTPFKTIVIKKRNISNIDNDEADFIDEMYEEAIEKGYYNDSVVNDKIDEDNFGIINNDNDEITVNILDNTILVTEEEDKNRKDIIEIGDFEEIDLEDEE